MRTEELSNRDKQLDQLLEAVLKSSKYRNVCEDLIKNIGVRELSRRQNLKMAIKSTKNKLHQIGGAYFLQKPNYELWLEELRNAQNSRNEDLFRRTCAEIMSYHYSTRDRLKIIDRFYARIFSLLPPIHSIMDIACGFHPLSIPWMPLSGKVKYYAYDVYKDLVNFLNDFMAIANVHGYAETRDVVQNTPKIKTDLAFILSTLPCLEQIEKSAGLKILESMNANFLVASFPVRSLGGREKNMRRHYTTRFNELTQAKDWVVQQLDFSTELVFLITKNL
jgi:16S rRNA (guanine(1405)-N(7))-methyltransferase